MERRSASAECGGTGEGAAARATLIERRPSGVPPSGEAFCGLEALQGVDSLTALDLTKGDYAPIIESYR